jgi:hypothetical protein
LYPTGQWTDPNGNIYTGLYESDSATGIHTVMYADGSTGTVRAEETDGTNWTWVNI